MKLRLFERRYIDMVTNCFRTETGFGICLIKDGNETGAPSLPYPLGTRVSIVDFDQGDDGLLHITTQGEVEFELLTYAADKNQLLIGEVSELPAQASVPMSPEIEQLASKLELILTYVEPEISFAQKRLDDADWVCHRLLELLPLAPQAKYELLQLKSNHERLEALSAFKIEIGQGS